jgi:hypothetical protein
LSRATSLTPASILAITDRRDISMLKKFMHRRSIAQAGANLSSYYSWSPGR